MFCVSLTGLTWEGYIPPVSVTRGFVGEFLEYLCMNCLSSDRRAGDILLVESRPFLGEY